MANKSATPPIPVSTTEGENIINPVTGAPETDPLRRFAIKNNFWYVNKRGEFCVNWNGIKRTVYPHWDIPRYFGFTEEERELYYKLCSESFYPLRSVAYLLGLKTPKQGIKFVFDADIPLYRINNILYVFSGDIVRAVNACRVDTSDPIVRAVIERHHGRRWEGTHYLRLKRETAIREEGTPSGDEEVKNE